MNRIVFFVVEPQVLKLILSDDVIDIDLMDRRLTVNRVAIPLPATKDGSGANREVLGFSLESPCHGPLLHARNNDTTLQIHLPFHGIILDVRSEDDIHIKVRQN